MLKTDLVRLASLFLLITLLAGPASATEEPDLPLVDGDFASAILVDAQSGMPLAAKNPDQRRQPASMLKMMTELIILERVDEGDIAMTDTVTVSARASRMGGSQVYLKHGERFSVEELLAALAIHSANDAAVALAEHTAGSVEAFVDLMNYRARDLGMTSSEFHSVHGLPPGRGQSPDLTTARDMAVLARALIQHPEALVWSNQKTAPFRDGKFTLYNPNKLVGSYRGLDGLKTGYHGQAGYCVTATAVQKDVRLISVVLGCPTDRGRATETTRLLSFGFNLYQQVTRVAEAGLPVEDTVAVANGKSADIGLVYASPLVVAIPRDREGDVQLRRQVETPIPAPVAAGEKLGEAVAVLDGYELGRVDLLAAETVEKGNWFHRLFH
jgi:D-alanyl-D-alanine carboxypeptidase (penicillin-binding protein 5/6)